MSNQINPANEPVVAVCGNVARVYGAEDKGRRPFMFERVFAHHGAAVLFAQEFEDRQNKRS